MTDPRPRDPGHAPGPDLTEDTEPVGTLAEEAAKLFAVLRDRSNQGNGHRAGAGAALLRGLAGYARGAAGGAGDEGEQEGAFEGEYGACAACPLCRALTLLRRSDSDVRDQFLQAADSLLDAVEDWLDSREHDAEHPG